MSHKLNGSCFACQYRQNTLEILRSFVGLPISLCDLAALLDPMRWRLFPFEAESLRHPPSFNQLAGSSQPELMEEEPQLPREGTEPHTIAWQASQPQHPLHSQRGAVPAALGYIEPGLPELPMDFPHFPLANFTEADPSSSVNGISSDGASRCSRHMASRVHHLPRSTRGPSTPGPPDAIDQLVRCLSSYQMPQHTSNSQDISFASLPSSYQAAMSVDGIQRPGQRRNRNSVSSLLRETQGVGNPVAMPFMEPPIQEVMCTTRNGHPVTSRSRNSESSEPFHGAWGDGCNRHLSPSASYHASACAGDGASALGNARPIFHAEEETHPVPVCQHEPSELRRQHQPTLGMERERNGTSGASSGRCVQRAEPSYALPASPQQEGFGVSVCIGHSNELMAFMEQTLGRGRQGGDHQPPDYRGCP